MSVQTYWLPHSSQIIYQKYSTTFNYPMFRTALLEMRRLLMSTDAPLFVIIDYRSVEQVQPFSMLRGGVLIENVRTPNAVGGVAIARAGSFIFRYNALWMRLGRMIGSQAAFDFELTTTPESAMQIIEQMAQKHGIELVSPT